MDPTSLNGRRKTIALARATTALAVLLLAFRLFLVPSSFAATDNDKGTTFEDRAAVEKMSRSRYRDLEVASLVIILVVGGGAILWAVRRRKS
jgi:hypothetical protein